jgi:hypothetical protein
MLAQAMLTAKAALRRVNDDAPGRDYFDARAARASGGLSAQVARPGASKPNCLWEVNMTGGESRRSPDRLCASRAQPECPVCPGDEE